MEGLDFDSVLSTWSKNFHTNDATCIDSTMQCKEPTSDGIAIPNKYYFKKTVFRKILEATGKKHYYQVEAVMSW